MARERSVEIGFDNPFLKRAVAAAPVEDPLEVDELFGAALTAQGPSAPAAPATDVAVSPVLQRRELTTYPAVTVAGAHGGAGASTLAALLGQGAFDAGVCWPVAGGWARPLPILPVVLVARTHAAGLAAAERIAQSWARGELGQSRLVGLVLVDDAPKLTRTQKAVAKRVSLMTPVAWHIGWQPSWREVSDPAAERPPVRVRRTLEHIHRAAGDNPVVENTGP